MRFVVIAVSLALGTSAAAQTTPATSEPPSTAADAPIQSGPAPQEPVTQDAPQCSVDRDCPGALFCVSGQCVAQGPTGAPAPDVSVTPAQPAQRDTQFGINLDAGIPDGVALGLLYRPVHFLRVGASGSYNGFGFGARGTVTLAPFKFFITPTLSVEAGHYWAADVGPLVRQAGLEVPPEAAPLLQEVAYDYGNAHVGFEVGVPQYFMFFLRGGISYVRSTVENFGQVVQAASGDPTLEVADLRVRVTVPSLKLGITAFF